LLVFFFQFLTVHDRYLGVMFIYMHYLACCHTPQLPAAPKRIKTRVARHDACESFT